MEATDEILGTHTSDNVNGTSSSFLYDGTNLVQQLSGTTPTANYLTGGLDQTFQVSNSAGTSSLLTDNLGSTIALVNGAVQITTSYTYDPFGTVATSGVANSNPIQYAGTQNDGTGLYSTGARYYSPSRSRFISQDPIGFAGGTTDLYQQVGDNPTNGTDPVGTWNPFDPGGMVSGMNGAAGAGGHTTGTTTGGGTTTDKKPPPWWQQWCPKPPKGYDKFGNPIDPTPQKKK